MAQVVAPGSPVNPQQQQQHAPHGTKRSAENSLEHEQRLSKRFDLLNLGMHLTPTQTSFHSLTTNAVDNNGTRLYIPVPGSTDSPRRSSSPISAPHPLASTLPLKNRTRTRTPRPPRSDGMEIEDTPHRVYIHDLAAELSDIESDEENPIFLADIEKHLSKIPKHVLMGPEPKSNKDNQVVLYNVPSSLSVPEERDGVRKAIVEARQRIRTGQASMVREVGVDRRPPPPPPPPASSFDVVDDAMDID
jgi:hypothetical protein